MIAAFEGHELITELPQSFESILRPYIGFLTFGIDLAAGIIIIIPSSHLYFHFLKY